MVNTAGEEENEEEEKEKNSAFHVVELGLEERVQGKEL